ncbi:hypothetical protein F4808DRAFT_442157 [Astrocystis sublimbata]|nr:hypothetical protein F4808DRAFT_442157 [Astrocystis sublimbata]
MLSTSRTTRTTHRVLSLRDHGSRVQTRTFRFGMWSSCRNLASNSLEREIRRRRFLKLPPFDNARMRAAWSDVLFQEERKPRRNSPRSWTSASPRHSWHHAMQREMENRKAESLRHMHPLFQTWSSYLGRFIEPLFYNTPSENSSFQRHDKPPAGHHPTNLNPKNSKPREPVHSPATPGPDEAYVIDPITNRKVRKGEVDGPVEPAPQPTTRYSKYHKPQSPPSAPPNVESERPPIYSNGPPPEAELRKYTEVNFDDWAAPAAHSPEAPPELASYTFDNSEMRSQEYSLNHLPPEESPAEEVDDLSKYRNTALDEPLENALDTKNITDSSKSVRRDPKSQQIQSELDNYGPFMYNENSPTQTEDGKHASKVSEPSHGRYPTTYDDLHTYELRVAEEARNQDRSPKQYEDLDAYKDFAAQPPNTTEAPKRDTLTASLLDYESKDKSGVTLGDRFEYDSGGSRDIPTTMGHLFNQQYCNHTSPEKKQDSPITRGRKQLNQQMNEIGATSDAMDRFISSNLQNVRHKYERFQNKDQDADLLSEGAFASTDKSPIEPRQPIGHAAKGDTKQRASSGEDLYSRQPQGLENSFSEECGGRQTMPIYTKSYGGVSDKKESSIPEPAVVHDSEAFPDSSVAFDTDTYYHRDPEIDGVPPRPSGSTPEPAQSPADTASSDNSTSCTYAYKVLVYNPETQLINMAKISPTEPDPSAALSLSEALSRLNYSAKFFPHLLPLEAEGFEIAFGADNFLVFRQKLPPAMKTKFAGRNTQTTTSKGGNGNTRAYVNPIDMMGAAVPNAAAFISPTGFLNYDMPRTPAPSSINNMTRNRYSRHMYNQEGKSQTDEGTKTKKTNVATRVLVGGVWVAGLSYALGVVTEYFHTGGAEGKGPEGFSPI